eukprot:scaffold39339_cov62-Phaeocystis_antarctica.AAC.4
MPSLLIRVQNDTKALKGAQCRPRSNCRLHEAHVHRRKTHVLHRREQLSLEPLTGLPPPHHPLEDSLLVLGHQPVLLHQRQHLRAGRRLRRQLLEAVKGRPDRGLLERGQRVEIGEPPHVERVAWCELRLDRAGARRLERVDHQPRRRVEHLGQQARLHLARALVDEGQQRLEHWRAEPLDRVGGARCVAHARVEETEEIPRGRGQRCPVRLELDALGTDGDVGELVFAPEGGERGVVRLAAAQRDLGRGGGGGGRGARGRAGSLARRHPSRSLNFSRSCARDDVCFAARGRKTRTPSAWIWLRVCPPRQVYTYVGVLPRPLPEAHHCQPPVTGGPVIGQVWRGK